MSVKSCNIFRSVRNGSLAKDETEQPDTAETTGVDISKTTRSSNIFRSVRSGSLAKDETEQLRLMGLA